MTRLCACGCGASLEAMRRDAVFASGACRTRARWAHSAHKAVTRRPSRDGTGAKLYLTGEQLFAVGKLGALPTAVRAKANRAWERVR